MISSAVPDWQTFKGGTRSRVALWLLSEVGPGGVFTKADLRQAFPGVEQVDRRMRDLRADAWVIENYRVDRSLASDELRLVTIGGSVWDKAYRSRSNVRPSAKERQETLLADGFACTTCGISGGEAFPDDAIRTAKLSVTRQQYPDNGTHLTTQCDRCLAGPTSPDLRDLIDRVEKLDSQDAAVLANWMKNGRRPIRPIDIIWAHSRGLGPDQQASLEALVSGVSNRDD